MHTLIFNPLFVLACAVYLAYALYLALALAGSYWKARLVGDEDMSARAAFALIVFAALFWPLYWIAVCLLDRRFDDGEA